MNEEKLIIDNVGLIYAVLKRLNLYHRLDEFYDVGMIGLVKGAKKYNPNLGYTVSTYLYRCIYNEILMYIRNNNTSKKIPEHLIISLSAKTTDNLSIGDAIEDDFDIEEDLMNKEIIERLHKEIANLSEVEQLVINYTFGLNGCEKLKQSEIALIVNYKQAHVSRIKGKALAKLRKAMRDGSD